MMTPTPICTSTLTRGLVAAAMLSALLLATGCASRYIETFDPLKFDQEAEIVDVPAHREVLEIVGAYKTAMEDKDVQALRGLVSAEYYENAGTSETNEDDYGFVGLDTVLARLSDAVRSLRFEIIVKDVQVDGDRAFVTFEYVWNYMYEVGDIPHWEAGRDLNRMHLVKDQGGLWKISRGL